MSRMTRQHQVGARLMWASSIGFALFVLLCVAVSAACAVATDSTTEGFSSTNQQLGASLVLPSVDELLGGAQAQLVRTARRSAPAAVAQRAASRSAFEGLSSHAALAESARAFPALAYVGGGVPQLASGERIVRYPTTHAAQVSLPGRIGVIEAIEPIASTTSHGAHVPFDLALGRASNGYTPVRSPVELNVPSALSRGVELPEVGVSLVPVDRRGVALAASAARPEGAGVLWNVANDSSVHDLAAIAKATPRGFDLSTMLFSQRSPGQLFFRVGMPAGARLEHEQDGSLRIAKGHQKIAAISPVAAEDAEGTSVPVSVSVRGDVISVDVHTKGDYLYPIVVDPEVNDSQLAKVTAGKRSNWEFHTNSPHFSNSESNGGPGAERLETKASGGYGTNEWGFWGYQTKGVSHIYEIKTETSAHNSGAKVESFLEFEEAPPVGTLFGILETKKILSSPFENAEYEHKAVTLCAANSAKAEECLPGSGKPNNAVHFQQSTTASSGTGFSDAMTQGIVSISEPSGTHSTTGYNTTSPTLEFELEREGKEVKVSRQNVLYGSGGWLSSSNGALALNSSDPGIGVSDTKLEYESSAGHFSQLFEHNYLGVENACQGVQCYSTHTEYATLPSGLSDGEQTIRYRAEEAITGTQSLEAEGQTKVKVDTKAPHSLYVEGLPSGNELSERPYELTIEATDGEGSSIPSSGIKSIALFLDGHEVGAATGSCSVAKGQCTAKRKAIVNGAELGAGKHDIKIVALDSAGNEAQQYEPISIRHSTPVALGPGSVDLESGDFSLGVSDVSLGSGLTFGRSYRSRSLYAGETGPLGPQWSLSLGSTETLQELVNGGVLLTSANGSQAIFAALGGGKFESPVGDSNLELSLEESKEKQKLAYYLKNVAAHTSVKFTRPAGASYWAPSKQEGTVASDTVSYAYQLGKFVEYPVTGAGEIRPQQIVAGPDGNLWFTDGREVSKIAKVNPHGGTITEYSTGTSGAEAIAPGSDGNIWFSTYTGNVLTMSPSGTVTTKRSACSCGSLAAGPGGKMWFTNYNPAHVGWMTSSGEFQEYALPAGSGPSEIAAGSDGNMWFAEGKAGKIGKVTPTGAITEYVLPGGYMPSALIKGADGNIWYVSWKSGANDKIGKITTTGAITEYSLVAGSEPRAITAGVDGNLWLADTNLGRITKVTQAGTIAGEYSIPGPAPYGAAPEGIAPGPEGNIWFTGALSKDVGVVPTTGPPIEPTEALAPTQAGVSCSPELKPGCRALKFKYAATTTAAGEGKSEWGNFQTRLTEVLIKAYNPSSKEMTEVAVAKYVYDKQGRLRAEWDPRITPSLTTTYGYDAEGHVTALTPPGQESWAFTYGTIPGDLGTGRLLKVARAPASFELWKGEPVANTSLPSISGVPRESIRLSVSKGVWSGSPPAYSYQWQRCPASGACTAIPGATNANYTPTAEDVGDTLNAVVTATNGAGSVSASRTTAAVANLASAWTEYSLPSGSGAKAIAPGPENTWWFTDFTSSKIGKFNGYTFTEYSLPAASGPEALVKGPDGNMWFVNYSSSKIGKITPSGTITEYALPANSGPKSIVTGPDGNLWFTEVLKSKVGKVTTAGAITEYAVGGHTTGIIAGPDGNLWFTEGEAHKVGKITTTGAVTEYSLPTGGFPFGIVAGPDGNLWYANRTSPKVGKITTSGAVTEYEIPEKNPEWITSLNGYLWVSAKATPSILRITTSGATKTYPLAAGSEPQRMAPLGGSGELWCAEFNDKIAWLKQGSLAEGGVVAPEAGTTVDYGVPLTGAEAPHSMSESEVAKWGQHDDPVEATAIFPPDEPQSWPASSYKRATVYYLDGQGRQVNVAAPSTSSSYGSVATSEYNEYNDVVRTLSPDNRATALEAGASSVEKSKLLDTQNTYNGEGAKEGEVEEPGTRLIDSVGPQHKVTYVAGHEQKESLARLHSKFFYDEGAPGGESYDLLTKKTTLAQLANEEEVEVRTTKTSYSGQSNLGWKLRAPTSVTSYDPEGNPLSKGATAYDPTTGQVTETRGTAAETTLSYAKKFGEAGSEAGRLKAPWGTAVNAEGALLVVDSTNSRIEKFSAEGAYVSSFGTAGSGNGQLKEPQGIALDSAGNVWVADSGNNRIEEFSSTGAFVKIVGSLGTESGKLKGPSDIAFDPKGNLWVADTGNSRVEKFNKEGIYSSEFGSAGTEPGKLSEPKGIAIDSAEHVWVADTANNRIQEFSGTGSLLKRFGTPGAGEGQLNTPVDLKIDAQGNIWTADSRNNRAEAFSPQGAYVTQIGFKGTVNGQLSEPKGLAFDATGKAWVTDSANNRLEQWSKGPNAHDQKTIYYSTASNGEYPTCGGHPEWAGLVCESLPAKQPELMGLPPLPTTIYASYNIYDEPETITETFGSSSRTKKQTYDAAGRRSSSETTATSGKALPKVSFTYNEAQGALEKESAEEKSLTSEFNRLGQLTKYTDADGNSAKYTYQGPENDYLLSEASDSSASGTSKQSYEYDPTTKLRTKLIDSAAGTFTAGYDTEGKLTSESYPYGLCVTYAYNSIGEATSLQYIKSSNCSEAEAGTYYSDSRSASIRGEMLKQESSLANETYTYDASGRLSETQETPSGEGCTVRAYSYDEEADRASSTTRAPGIGGACQTEGGSTESHNYDEGNRLADAEMAYDAYGNVTKLPAADAEGHELSSTYYVDNAVATQTQSGVTNEYKLDPEGRTRELISGATKTIDHYDSSGEAIAWSESPEKWVRNIAGIDGTLLATQTNGETPVLQLHDLQGNVVGTIGDKSGETKLLSHYNSSEFGVPTGGKAPPKFAYLGALGTESSFSTGVITYGASSYVPQTGRALQSEAVEPPGLPGGSGAGAPYTMQEEPWNMQGAAREAAEAPGLEAARERTAFEAAEGTFVDPWVHTTMNRSKAASLAEEYWEAEAFAVVAAMNDVPTDFVEALGQKFGDFLSKFTDAYKWLDDAGTMLNKCAQNKRVANGHPVNICWFEYEQIEWTPGVNIFGVQINAPVTLKFPNFSVEPRVNECLYVQGGSLACVANVYIKPEL